VQVGRPGIGPASLAAPYTARQKRAMLMRTQKNRSVSEVAVRPPMHRASKPACRACGIAADDSPDGRKVKRGHRLSEVVSRIWALMIARTRSVTCWP
jgi:hypothetical protein